jgi:Flp pilus assembly protein TadG
LKDEHTMMIRRAILADRRGVSMVEAAVVYPVTMLIMIGMLVLGIGVFRYDQLQFLAREGARYASVHGPTYASEANSATPAPSPRAAVAAWSDIETNVLTPLATGTGLSGVTGTVTYTPTPPTTTSPSTVTVQLNYTWVPEGLFKTSTTFTASSTMPVVY